MNRLSTTTGDVVQEMKGTCLNAMSREDYKKKKKELKRIAS